MGLDMWFWVIYVLSLVFSMYIEYVPGSAYPWPKGLRWLVFYILVGLLGYRVFGPVVK